MVSGGKAETGMAMESGENSRTEGIEAFRLSRPDESRGRTQKRQPRVLGAFLFATIIALLPAPLHAVDTARGFLLGALSATGQGIQADEARLASGRELLADDPANEAIYQALEAQVRAMDRLGANNADMRSYYRFQDSVLGQVISSLQRIRVLALGLGDSTLGPDDISIIDDEIRQYYDDISTTLAQADFNGNRPFAALLARPEVARWFSRKNYYQLDSIDRLLSAMIDERSRIGTADEALAFASKGDAVAAENLAASQGASATDVAAVHSSLATENLLFLVDLFFLK